MDSQLISKVLTIGIPTYNSSETLIECLKSLENQNYYEDDKVEILISDNGSNYDITSTLNKALTKPFFQKLKISINTKNLGYDANLQILAEKSNGEYLKLLADDDLVSKNFVSDLLNLIESQSPDLIISNFIFLSQDLKEVKKKSWFEAFKVEDNQDALPFLDCTNNAHGQMSSLTFRTQSIKDLEEPKNKTNYIHVYWFFCLLEKSITVVEKKTNISVRQGSPNFSGNNFTEIITPIGGILAIQFSKIKNDCLKKTLVARQKAYCLSRLTAVNGQSLLQRARIFGAFLPHFKSSIKFWLYWVPIIMMPNCIRFAIKGFRKQFLKIICQNKSDNF
jgi:glycosyltransferase involved in cell wall biosynthesis